MTGVKLSDLPSVGAPREGDIFYVLRDNTDAGVVFNLDALKGDKGDPGEDGADGAKGDKGDKGDKGEPGEPGKGGGVSEADPAWVEDDISSGTWDDGGRTYTPTGDGISVVHSLGDTSISVIPGDKITMSLTASVVGSAGGFEPRIDEFHLALGDTRISATNIAQVYAGAIEVVVIVDTAATGTPNANIRYGFDGASPVEMRVSGTYTLERKGALYDVVVELIHGEIPGYPNPVNLGFASAAARDDYVRRLDNLPWYHKPDQRALVQGVQVWTNGGKEELVLADDTASRSAQIAIPAAWQNGTPENPITFTLSIPGVSITQVLGDTGAVLEQSNGPTGTFISTSTLTFFRLNWGGNAAGGYSMTLSRDAGAARTPLTASADGFTMPPDAQLAVPALAHSTLYVGPDQTITPVGSRDGFFLYDLAAGTHPSTPYYLAHDTSAPELQVVADTRDNTERSEATAAGLARVVAARGQEEPVRDRLSLTQTTEAVYSFAREPFWVRETELAINGSATIPVSGKQVFYGSFGVSGADGDLLATDGTAIVGVQGGRVGIWQYFAAVAEVRENQQVQTWATEASGRGIGGSYIDVPDGTGAAGTTTDTALSLTRGTPTASQAFTIEYYDDAGGRRNDYTPVVVAANENSPTIEHTYSGNNEAHGFLTITRQADGSLRVENEVRNGNPLVDGATLFIRVSHLETESVITTPARAAHTDFVDIAAADGGNNPFAVCVSSNIAVAFISARVNGQTASVESERPIPSGNTYKVGSDEVPVLGWEQNINRVGGINDSFARLLVERAAGSNDPYLGQRTTTEEHHNYLDFNAVPRALNPETGVLEVLGGGGASSHVLLGTARYPSVGGSVDPRAPLSPVFTPGPDIVYFETAGDTPAHNMIGSNDIVRGTDDYFATFLNAGRLLAEGLSVAGLEITYSVDGGTTWYPAYPSGVSSNDLLTYTAEFEGDGTPFWEIRNERLSFGAIGERRIFVFSTNLITNPQDILIRYYAKRIT